VSGKASGNNPSTTSANAGQRLAAEQRRNASQRRGAGGGAGGSGARPAGPSKASGVAPVVGPGPVAGNAPVSAVAPPVAPTGPRDPAKYLLLEVPNWNSADDPADQMGSYLRLGTVPDPRIAGQPDAPPTSGEDLASYANVAHLDGHVTEFLDDERIRDGCPGFVPVDERKEESAILHTKGGWRDHSDGNRITTTRGDKVEVIRGNYKLVVLGRQDDPGGAGWDVSGGHIEGLGIKSSISWVQTFGGTWKTIETSEKGDTDTTQHGNSVNRSFGESIDSTTGSEDEQRPLFDAEDNFTGMTPAPNPTIKDRTWARRMESYTGSSKRPVPVMINETWVVEMGSKTNATSMSDETHVKETMSSKTIVGAGMTSTTIAGTMMDTTIAASMTSVNLTDMTNINVGKQANITIGPQENINIGPTLDLTLSAMLQVCLSAGVSLNLGPKADYTFPETFNMSPSHSEVAATSSSVAGVASYVAGVYKVTAGMIMLG
jgi:prepilin-type processing-associated H-X9-DG protein